MGRKKETGTQTNGGADPDNRSTRELAVLSPLLTKIDEEFEGNSEDEADIEDVKVDEDADCVCEEENDDGDYE